MICPVCQENMKFYHSCKDSLVSGETFSVQKCPMCGFALTENPPSPGEIGRYYHSEAYISHSNTRKGLVAWIYQGVRSVMIRRKRLLIEKISGKDPGSILDIGCGTAHFLHEMHKAGWETKGIEPDKNAREFAAKRFGLEINGPEYLNSLCEQAREFDVITLWHSLEHIHDLTGTLVKLRKMLRSGGLLVVALPNRTGYDASLYGKDWAAWDVPRHLWHFSLYAAQKLFQTNGFVSKGILPMPFDAFYVAMLTHQWRRDSFPVIRGFLTGIAGWWYSRKKVQASSSLIYLFSIRKQTL